MVEWRYGDHNDASVADVVEVLRRLPANAVVEWSDDTVGDDDVLTGWLDIWAPAVARPIAMNWVWTAMDPVSAADSPAAERARAGPLDLVVAFDGVPPDDIPGWRPAVISRVLQEWTSRFVGRSDIQFRYEPTLCSDMALELERSAAEQPQRGP